MNIQNLIRPDLLSFNAYSAVRNDSAHATIYLDANESPYVDLTITGYALNRYPQKQPRKAIEKLAKIYQVQPKNILLTRGSDEIIDLLIRLFCVAGQDSILYCPPTFGMYAICARLQNAKIITVPLQPNFQLNLSAIHTNWQPGTKLIFLCSPNNPTGNLLDRNSIFSLCTAFSEHSFIVVDEAYIEYSHTESLTFFLKKYPNLIILRTLSKAYGLAGIRCGAILANPEVIFWLNKIIAPFPLPHSTAITLQTALTEKYLLKNKQQIHEINLQKTILLEELKRLNFIQHVWPSDANFILIKVNDVDYVSQTLLKAGILVRNVTALGLEYCLRISIGLPSENEKLLTVLRDLQA